MKRTFKFRIYPNKEQKEKLEFTLNSCRFLYNSALRNRIEAYKHGVSISYNNQSNELKEIKNELPEFNNIHSQVLQDTLKRLDKSYKNFFRRVKLHQNPGFPRFKGKDRYDSFTYPQLGFNIKDNHIDLSKIGKIKLKYHRRIRGNIKICTVKREIDQWYVCLSCEIENNIQQKKQIENSIGIDVGLSSFLTDSNGKKESNPNFLNKSESKLKETQTQFSKKKSRKQKLKLQKLHRKVKNQRKDFHHKLSKQLVNEFDCICFENLNIKNMINGGSYNKSIHDVGWNQFLNMISYKAEEAGIQSIKVDPFYTSINCSDCGFPVYKYIHERTHSCPNCGLSIDRDHNAAINILRLGTSLLKKEAACL